MIDYFLLMFAQQIVMPESGAVSWTVIGDDLLPVPAAEAFCPTWPRWSDRLGQSGRGDDALTVDAAQRRCVVQRGEAQETLAGLHEPQDSACDNGMCFT